MKEEKTQPSGSPMLCAIQSTLAHHRTEAVMREKRRRRRGEAILCEHFYLYLRFHHLSRGL